MTWQETKERIASDLYRHEGRAGFGAMLKTLRNSRSFKITFWFRLAQFVQASGIPVVKQLVKWQYRRVTTRYCVDLPVRTTVGKGLIIYHCYGMVIHEDSMIGDNCMLAHQVTLATEKGGAPVIGNQVRIAPGAKIVGGVDVGDYVVVGTNCVVVRDIPAHCVSVGIPNKIIDRPYEDDANRYFWPPSLEAQKRENHKQGAFTE